MLAFTAPHSDAADPPSETLTAELEGAKPYLNRMRAAYYYVGLARLSDASEDTQAEAVTQWDASVDAFFDYYKSRPLLQAEGRLDGKNRTLAVLLERICSTAALHSVVESILAENKRSGKGRGRYLVGRSFRYGARYYLEELREEVNAFLQVVPGYGVKGESAKQIADRLTGYADDTETASPE